MKILYDQKCHSYIIIILLITFFFVLFYNAFSPVPAKSRIVDIDMDVPLIPVCPEELRHYQHLIDDFEHRRQLEYYNQRGIYQRQQHYEGMIRPYSD